MTLINWAQIRWHHSKGNLVITHTRQLSWHSPTTVMKENKKELYTFLNALSLSLSPNSIAGEFSLKKKLKKLKNSSNSPATEMPQNLPQHFPL